MIQHLCTEYTSGQRNRAIRSAFCLLKWTIIQTSHEEVMQVHSSDEMLNFNGKLDMHVSARCTWKITLAISWI